MTTRAEIVGYVIGVVAVAVFVVYVTINIFADPVAQVAEFCAEDMACWDCETMGNRICGPLKEET